MLKISQSDRVIYPKSPLFFSYQHRQTNASFSIWHSVNSLRIHVEKTTCVEHTSPSIPPSSIHSIMGIEDQKEEREVLDSIFPDEITGSQIARSANMKSGISNLVP